MKQTVEMYMPVAGRLVPLKDVNQYITEDIVDGMGLGILPEADIFYSPVSGEVLFVSESLNSVAINVDDKFTILLQCGVHTEELEGRGFATYVKAKDKVTAGDKLLYMDRDYINNKAEATSVLLITNKTNIENVEINYSCEEPFQRMMKVILK